MSIEKSKSKEANIKKKDLSLVERIKGTAKKAVSVAAIVYSVNTLIPIVLYSACNDGSERDIMSVQAAEAGGFGRIDLNHYARQGLLSKSKSLEQKTLDWLKYSNVLAETLLEYEICADRSLDEAVEKGKGDCQHLARLTYAKFLAISEKIDMKEMRENVRLTGGLRYSSDMWMGHEWIEIKKDGKWVPYETTAISGRIDLKTEQVSPVDIILIGKADLLPDPNKYVRERSIQVNQNGKVNDNVHWWNSLTDLGGLGRKLINVQRLKSMMPQTKAQNSQTFAPNSGDTYRQQLGRRKSLKPYNSRHRG
jgi:hypothetical protein